MSTVIIAPSVNQGLTTQLDDGTTIYAGDVLGCTAAIWNLHARYPAYYRHLVNAVVHGDEILDPFVLNLMFKDNIDNLCFDKKGNPTPTFKECLEGYSEGYERT